MAEPLDWLDDGTPYSPRFGDRYHSEQGGLAQAREVFLHGCGLPAAWAHQPQWRILETGFGFGLNFLTTWAAWRADPQRPRLLHFVSLEAWPVAADDLLRATRVHPALAPLAQELHRHYWGLLPGIHRIALDGGQVLLTLCIGDAQTLLRQQDWTVDSVYLDGFSPQRNPEVWSLHTLKAVARCCRRGTRLATWTVARAVRDDLAQCGFTVAKVPGVPPKRDNLHATFDPRWEPRQAQVASAAHTASAAPGATPAPGTSPAPSTSTPARCIVIGAGLAGAAVAASLARRGWQVQVLDQGDAPAAGASGLPAGVFAPHVSVDDSVVSRLSRSGVRATLQAAAQYLQEGTDWQPSGVLQHHVDGKRGLPTDWDAGPGADWSHAAPDVVRAALGIAPGVGATWHRRGGWIRPARLVQALLAQPGVQFHGGQAVARLVRVANSSADLWQALDAQGRVLASAPLVVVATGFGSPQLLAQTDPALARWPLGIVRGQVTGARQADLPWPGPAFPVNGHGNAVPAF
ncbi:MAG: tRNA (5-methylaminomethyl-2-thiouridine)(34)-methyltransferase MnmD, partial [Giesbergeria sp.]|nr:tRNA (5-methylaminomethyl-2-thiouridine)(34)-methyltransferase MnmD [Giesbergeria sp.]